MWYYEYNHSEESAANKVDRLTAEGIEAYYAPNENGSYRVFWYEN